MTFLELRFFAVDATHVCDVQALRAGQSRVIGKRWDTDAGRYVCTPEPGLLRLQPSELASDRAALRKNIQAGELRCADEATATALGLAFSPAKE